MLSDPATVFAALGDPTRLALLGRLHGGEALSIRDLTEGLPISRQGVTKHLRVLEEAGLLASERASREVLFRGRPEGLSAAQAHLERIAGAWDDALARLKAQAEG